MINKILDISMLDKDKLKKLDDYIDSLQGDKQEQLIHILHKAQDLFRYLPKNLQLYIARALDMPAVKVNGVVSFYTFFNQEPVGKYVVSVCMGTACFVKGADQVLKRVLKTLNIKKGEMTDDGLFTVKDVRCIGACGLAPILTVNDKVYGRVTPNEVEDILHHYRSFKK